MAPAGTKPARPKEELIISRGPCHGFCPVYRVSVTPGGLVSFDGMQHTALLGSRTRAVSRKVYEEVSRAILPMRPPTGSVRDWRCEHQPTDTSLITLEWQREDGTRTVLRYKLGCRSADGAMIERLIERQLQRLGVVGWLRQASPPDSRHVLNDTSDKTGRGSSLRK
ncbi:DUF6438 domain-containing protein [Novosphingobium indicum]|nr:DUF6438 domain-containing protein [Novosphingobium indicum]